MGFIQKLKGLISGKKDRVQKSESAVSPGARRHEQGRKGDAPDSKPAPSQGRKGDRPRRRGRGRHQARSRGTEGLAEQKGEQQKPQKPAREGAEPGTGGGQGRGRKRRRRGRGRPGGQEKPVAAETREPEKPQGKMPRRKSRGRGRKELGGSSQRVDFPELLPIDRTSEEFINNEFRPLGLSDRIVLALAQNRFRVPTDIQTAVIPAALRGADLLGQAKTGTGKTVAFLMPIFERLDNHSTAIQALIVVPTRELCRQISWEARRFGRTLDFRVLSLYGGTAVNHEIEQLRQGGQIVVGTPGRLLDHIFNHNLDLSGLKTLVLDEADRMFDIGFRQDIIKIIKACPEGRQVMLLSATLDDEVEELSRRYMHDPVKLYLSRDEVSVESIWQRFITSTRHEKMGRLTRLLEHQRPTQSLIFTNTKRMSDALAMQLAKRGFKARCIHSDLSQNKREKIIDAFRTGQIEHLVATDVAARGLDITGISHVINYDIPDSAEDYIHRVGRTGRMGAAGKAFTFVTAEEGKQLTEVEKFINKQIEEWDGA
ncbi:MAG: DEAD/DEAH box helicase [Candidatus Glassbacteria bacterium]